MASPEKSGGIVTPIYVLKHPPLIEEIVAKDEDQARQIASTYHEGCQPEEWELIDVRGETKEDRHDA